MYWMLEVSNEINTRGKNKVNRAARVFIKADDLANSDFLYSNRALKGWMGCVAGGERKREREASERQKASGKIVNECMYV